MKSLPKLNEMEKLLRRSGIQNATTFAVNRKIHGKNERYWIASGHLPGGSVRQAEGNTAEIAGEELAKLFKVQLVKDSAQMEVEAQ